MPSIRSLFVAIATLSLALTLATAKDGRDFAGFYSLTNPSGEGGQVRVTFSAQLFNYSGADIQNAAVSVRETHPGSEVLGTYAPIELWRNGAATVLCIHLTVPQEEYQRWDARRQPAVIISYRDEQGRAWQRTAQINRRPSIPLDDPSAGQ